MVTTRYIDWKPEYIRLQLLKTITGTRIRKYRYTLLTRNLDSRRGCTPDLEGFTLVESRRNGSTRGGLAIYVRKPLKIENTSHNEYGIFIKILLPNSTRINIFNLYIPPY